MAIQQNQALFSLLGVTYGGNGITTFALPDLRGRVAVSAGPTISLGQEKGTEAVTLTEANLPAHSHTESIKVSSSVATLDVPTTSSSIAAPVLTVNGSSRALSGYNVAVANTPLMGVATTTSGGSTPINVMQPYIAMTYIIATEGIYPSRN